MATTYKLLFRDYRNVNDVVFNNVIGLSDGSSIIKTNTLTKSIVLHTDNPLKFTFNVNSNPIVIGVTNTNNNIFPAEEIGFLNLIHRADIVIENVENFDQYLTITYTPSNNNKMDVIDIPWPRSTLGLLDTNMYDVLRCACNMMGLTYRQSDNIPDKTSSKTINHYNEPISIYRIHANKLLYNDMEGITCTICDDTSIFLEDMNTVFMVNNNIAFVNFFSYGDGLTNMSFECPNNFKINKITLAGINQCYLFENGCIKLDYIDMIYFNPYSVMNADIRREIRLEIDSPNALELLNVKFNYTRVTAALKSRRNIMLAGTSGDSIFVL